MYFSVPESEWLYLCLSHCTRSLAGPLLTVNLGPPELPLTSVAPLRWAGSGSLLEWSTGKGITSESGLSSVPPKFTTTQNLRMRTYLETRSLQM